MYVCVCNAVSERAIRQAVANGTQTLEGLRMRTGCGTCCGCCEPMVEQILNESLSGAMSPPDDRNVVHLDRARSAR